MRPYLVTPGPSPNLGTGDVLRWILPKFAEQRTLHKVVVYTNDPWGLRVTVNDFVLVDLDRADLQAVPGGMADDQQTLWLCGSRHDPVQDEEGEWVSQCGGSLYLLETHARCEVSVTRRFGVGPIQFAVGGEMP